MNDHEEIRKKLGRITSGLPVLFGRMTIQMVDEKLIVTGWTSTFYFENLNRDEVGKELEGLKKDFSNLSASFVELSHILESNHLNIEYHMAYDTGKSGIALCSEIKGRLVWYI